MGDKLAVIQSDSTIKELGEIDNAVVKLVSNFNSLLSVTESVNKAFQSGKAKDYTNGLKQLKDLTKDYVRIEKELVDIKLKLAQVETQEAKTATEKNRARKEAANATIAETRAEAAQQRQSQASAGAYQKVSQEANKLKRQAKDLEAGILLLTRDFKNGLISQSQYSQELAKLQGQFSVVAGKARQLDSELKRIDANVGDRQRNVGNYQNAAMSGVKQLESQIKSMIAMYVGFQAVISGAGKLMHNNYELSDSLVDLQIRLNGNKKAADELFESLKQIDTRTSLGELVNTAAIVAKKGVAKEEIEGITKALDDYFIVAGKEAGNREEGTASIIKLISIFNEDKHITAERVTEIGTALVKLQNSGVATGAKMIDIAERIGAVRGITGVTLPQVLGFAAAIEQLGQKSEVAGTAGMQILTKILSDMPKYAKLANVSVEELRKAYSENPFEAVVMVAQGVLKTGDFERISQDLEEVGVRGARVKGVLGDIASNADFVRKRIKDAGLAINQTGYLAETAALKQETYAATVDKIKKEFELIGDSKGFMDLLKGTSVLLMNFIKIITAIPFGLVITGITLMTAAWAYYKGAAIQAAVATAWNNSESLLGIVRNNAAKLGLVSATAAQRAKTAAIQADTLAMNVNIASLENQIVQERFAIASIRGQIATTEAEIIAKRQQIATREAHIVTLEAEIIATRQAAAAQAALNTTTKASPLGLILGLLALAIPMLGLFADNTEKAAKKTRTLAENQKELNEALDKGVKSAAEEVSHLDELYTKYTNANTPLKEKNEIYKELVDYYPSYFGQLKTEKDLNDKLRSSYLELRDAIVSAARADAIRDKLKGRMSERLSRDEQLNRDTQNEIELNKKLKADTGVKKVNTQRFDGGDGKSFTVEFDSSDLLIASNKRLENLKKTKANNDRADSAEDKILLDMAFSEDKKTEKLRKDRAARLGKFAKAEEEKTKEKKDKPYTGAKLSGDQKDFVNVAQSERDNEIATAKEKLLKLEITQKEYWDAYMKIIQKYRDKISNYLKGGNAKEKQIEASVKRKAIEELEKANKEVFDNNKKDLEETYKMKYNSLESQSNELEKADYLTETDRLTKLIELDDQILSELDSYYEKQILLAKNASQETIELERKRDEERTKIEEKRFEKTKSLFEASKKDLEKQTEFSSSFEKLSNEEQKSLIISDKKLSNREKEYRLQLLDIDNQIKQNKLKIDELETLKRQYQVKISLASINGFVSSEDIKNIADLEASITNLKNANEELNSQGKSLVSDKVDGIRKSLSAGFKTLGFENLADAYDATMERLKGKTADWKDYAVLAVSAVLDSLSNLNNAQKEKTIAALDEQLKYSQQTTEQEVGFINSRLEALNNLEELTVEQMAERNRLEDEARTYKEQQRQREKLIETQKAKAEQKAAAQQALINGALAATMTLAQMGFIAGAIPAALALGFGIAQSIAIMAKDPVPKYFVGRNGGKAEWAWTQEKGAEVITDKNDNIKSLGSSKGASMTWLEAGDKVYTATESRRLLENLGSDAKVGKNLFRRVVEQSFYAPTVTVINNYKDNSDAIAEKIGRKFDQTMNRYDKPSLIKIDGLIYLYRGANYPEKIGKYDLKTGEETFFN